MDRLEPPLAFTLEPRPDHGERITLAAFGVVTAGWADLVRRVTLEQSGPKAAVEWVVDDPSRGSARVALWTIPRTKDAVRVERETARLVAEGLERIERGSEPEEFFSSEAAEAAREMLRALSDGVGRVVVSTYGRQITLTREGAGQVAPVPDRFSSLGSVEGALKTVSFSQDRPYFSVFRSQDGHAVRCYFEETRYLDEVLDLLRQRARVMVIGRVARRPDGIPFAVTEIREIQRLRSREELPGIDDILGLDPDLTEGLPAEEWLGKRRA